MIRTQHAVKKAVSLTLDQRTWVVIFNSYYTHFSNFVNTFFWNFLSFFCMTSLLSTDIKTFKQYVSLLMPFDDLKGPFLKTRSNFFLFFHFV